MSASTQFSQLDMWKPADELMHGIGHGDAMSYSSTEEMWADKRAQNSNDRNYRGITPEQVRTEGIKTPVDILHHRGRQVLEEGHHRVAAAYDVHPKTLVPVSHNWAGNQDYRPKMKPFSKPWKGL